jgi:hypothetical protein
MDGSAFRKISRTQPPRNGRLTFGGAGQIAHVTKSAAWTQINYYRLKFCAAFSKYFAHVFFDCPVSMGSINLNKPDVLMVT